MTHSIFLNTSNGAYVIDTDTIVRCQASSNYTKLFFTNAKTLVIAKTLGQLAEALQASAFVRVHQSHLINTHYIDAITNTSVLLKNGCTVSVSRRKLKHVMQQLLSS
jgi:two-component system, LytTR family, response regulator